MRDHTRPPPRPPRSHPIRSTLISAHSRARSSSWLRMRARRTRSPAADLSAFGVDPPRASRIGALLG